MLQMNFLVKSLEEINCFKILASSKAIRFPLAFLPAVIEVEHRSDRIDTKTIYVVLVQPKEGVGNQEVTDFVATIIEDQGAPVGMFTLTGIFMFK